ncbi:rhodanese-like domain-containing protein [Tissierella creatinini]|nr:rhodanese-like domain-containing protein [Tissierella creatinini]TJX60983.1 rhodanese-like domain-containing protein [Soehngenia saccharolytica]
MKNKSLKLMSLFLLLAVVLVGCGQAATPAETPAASETPAPAAETPAVANEMKYVSPADLKAAIEADSKDYIILDNRKVEDFNTSHIKGAVTADVDAANKGGDDEAGKESLKKALTEATGSETGSADATYALVCYSGKSYAQKATDLLIEMGVSPDQIVTLEGGMKAWEAAGDDYKGLLEQ